MDDCFRRVVYVPSKNSVVADCLSGMDKEDEEDEVTWEDNEEKMRVIGEGVVNMDEWRMEVSGVRVLQKVMMIASGVGEKKLVAEEVKLLWLGEG
ncbi:hypothetical protein NDU88_006115 [Pleurodeles waltl]|uniref:Uncharacterized protein n=1 Tax=Pleurodeles waltl TaxID=8319 RepID=A0AAV7W9P1_PLEWA|nr:hypothetical protein NDU88_006115 [Pleurodeles waltl]